MRRVNICRTGTNGALLITSGWAKKTYTWGELRPGVYFTEKIRTVLLPGKRMQWEKVNEWNWWRNKDTGWHEKATVAEPFNPFMYSSDGSSYFMFPERIQESALKYCQVEEWYHSVTHVWLEDMQNPSRNVLRYLSAYTQYPDIEMAVKLDLPDAVTDLVCDGLKNGRYLNWKGKNPAEFLRMSKVDAKRFLQSGGRMPQLRIYHELKKGKSVKNMEDFLKLVEMLGGANILQKIDECAKMAGVSLMQAGHYVHNQAGNKRDVGVTLQLWKDYMDMGRELGYDLTRMDVLMPKDLHKRHNDASDTLKVSKQQEELKHYSVRYKNLRKLYEFEMGGLCIIVPESSEDIVREGRTLRHCVGGYAARHVKGKVDILFLRNKRKPGTPLVTIEMKPRSNTMSEIHLVQIHGYKNEMYPHSVPAWKRYKWFLDAWTEWMRGGSKRDKKGKPVSPAEKEKTA